MHPLRGRRVSERTFTLAIVGFAAAVLLAVTALSYLILSNRQKLERQTIEKVTRRIVHIERPTDRQLARAVLRARAACLRDPRCRRELRRQTQLVLQHSTGGGRSVPSRPSPEAPAPGGSPPRPPHGPAPGGQQQPSPPSQQPAPPPARPRPPIDIPAPSLPLPVPFPGVCTPLIGVNCP